MVKAPLTIDLLWSLLSSRTYRLSIVIRVEQHEFELFMFSCGNPVHNSEIYPHRLNIIVDSSAKIRESNDCYWLAYGKPAEPRRSRALLDGQL